MSDILIDTSLLFDEDDDKLIEKVIQNESYRESDINQFYEFDHDAGEIWIYPNNYPIRDYQYNIVQKALFNNTLVALPTGMGKTFIAAVLMYNYYRWYPRGKIVFMAPTRPLVSQQIEACHKIMGTPLNDTVEMTGKTNPDKRKIMWDTKRVIFLTPQVMANDLSKGLCPSKYIKCLVVDEAHKALGNYAYCQVVNHLRLQNEQFRVLALTATPGKDLKAVEQVLANLMISHVEFRREDSIDVRPYTYGKTIQKIVIPLSPELLDFKAKVSNILEDCSKRLVDHNLVFKAGKLENYNKFTLIQARERFRAMTGRGGNNGQGRSGFSKGLCGVIERDFAVCITLLHALELLTFYGLRSFYTFVQNSIGNQNCTWHSPDSPGELNQGSSPLVAPSPAINRSFNNDMSSRSLSRIPEFNDLMNEVVQAMDPARRPNGAGTTPMEVGECQTTSHPKLAKLREIVRQHFSEQVVCCHANTNGAGSDPVDSCGVEGGTGKSETKSHIIVFSQYRESVLEISDILNTLRPLVRVGTFIGQASGAGANGRKKSSSLPNGKGYTQKDQLKVLQNFREGIYNTLVATCVGEEGLDVGHVDLIVCFDVHRSPVRHLQRIGRTGRARNGRVIVLLSEGREEKVYSQGLNNKRNIFKALEELIVRELSTHLNTSSTTKSIVSRNAPTYLESQTLPTRNAPLSNPRMVPSDVNPKPCRIFITAPVPGSPKKEGSVNGSEVPDNIGANAGDATKRRKRKSKGDRDASIKDGRIKRCGSTKIMESFCKPPPKTEDADMRVDVCSSELACLGEFNFADDRDIESSGRDRSGVGAKPETKLSNDKKAKTRKRKEDKTTSTTLCTPEVNHEQSNYSTQAGPLFQGSGGQPPRSRITWSQSRVPNPDSHEGTLSQTFGEFRDLLELDHSSIHEEDTCLFKDGRSPTPPAWFGSSGFKLPEEVNDIGVTSDNHNTPYGGHGMGPEKSPKMFHDTFAQPTKDKEANKNAFTQFNVPDYSSLASNFNLVDPDADGSIPSDAEETVFNRSRAVESCPKSPVFSGSIAPKSIVPRYLNRPGSMENILGVASPHQPDPLPLSPTHALPAEPGTPSTILNVSMDLFEDVAPSINRPIAPPTISSPQNYAPKTDEPPNPSTPTHHFSRFDLFETSFSDSNNSNSRFGDDSLAKESLNDAALVTSDPGLRLEREGTPILAVITESSVTATARAVFRPLDPDVWRSEFTLERSDTSSEGDQGSLSKGRCPSRYDTVDTLRNTTANPYDNPVALPRPRYFETNGNHTTGTLGHSSHVTPVCDRGQGGPFTPNQHSTPVSGKRGNAFMTCLLRAKHKFLLPHSPHPLDDRNSCALPRISAPLNVPHSDVPRRLTSRTPPLSLNSSRPHILPQTSGSDPDFDPADEIFKLIGSTRVTVRRRCIDSTSSSSPPIARSPPSNPKNHQNIVTQKINGGHGPRRYPIDNHPAPTRKEVVGRDFLDTEAQVSFDHGHLQPSDDDDCDVDGSELDLDLTGFVVGPESTRYEESQDRSAMEAYYMRSVKDAIPPTVKYKIGHVADKSFRRAEIYSQFPSTQELNETYAHDSFCVAGDQTEATSYADPREVGNSLADKYISSSADSADESFGGHPLRVTSKPKKARMRINKTAKSRATISRRFRRIEAIASSTDEAEEESEKCQPNLAHQIVANGTTPARSVVAMTNQNCCGSSEQRFDLTPSVFELGCTDSSDETYFEA